MNDAYSLLYALSNPLLPSRSISHHFPVATGNELDAALRIRRLAFCEQILRTWPVGIEKRASRRQ
jgi:hypothetical protein